MRILVCVKQVPDSSELRLDPNTNTVVRSGAPGVVNPFDAYALEAAARIKDGGECHITLLSMGPPQAAGALKACLGVGGDSAWLLCANELRGSDTMATAYALAQAIRHIQTEEGGFDAIFCGRQSVDGETAQVGPMLAELLGLPQVTNAVDITAGPQGFTVRRSWESGWETLRLPPPCLIAVDKPAYEPRLPSIKSKMTANRTQINTLDASQLRLAPDRVGLAGSPTYTGSTFPAKGRGGCTMVENAAALLDALRERAAL